MPSRPGLLLFVPGEWDVDPPGLAELRRYLSDEYGATLTVQQATGPMLVPVPLYIGAWRTGVNNALRQRIAATFFTLDRLELEDVGWGAWLAAGRLCPWAAKWAWSCRIGSALA